MVDADIFRSTSDTREPGKLSTVNRMTFDEIISKLPVVPAPPQPSGQHAAFEVSPKVIEHFVPPTFEIVDWPESAGVLVIEAPGAVGKTVTGEALASRLGWPLVRAEKAQVGSYSLSGLVNDALDFSDYLSRVRDASAGLVVDSLDEAHLKAGTQNFLAFVQNIISIRAKEVGRTQPSIILLSRTDTAELIRLAFDDSEEPVAHVKLSFFDHDSALSFLGGHLRGRFAATGQADYNVAFAAPRPFEQLVDERFRQLMQILIGRRPRDLREDWESCDEFLGYAPVLTVIAESAACTNPARELADLRKSSLGSNEQLLLEICEKILLREQDKFSKNFLLKLRASLPAADGREILAETVYSPQEQLIRVFAQATDSVLASTPPFDLPDSLRPMYEDAVGQFLADHPFIRNGQFSSAVFKDFVYASLADNLAGKASLERSPSRSIRDAGPFFAGFFAYLAGGAPTPKVPESLVLQLASSWRQWFELTGIRDGFIEVHLMEGHGYLASSSVEQERIGVQPVRQFEIYDMSGAFAMPHVPNNFLFVTNQGVVLGERNRALNVGSASLVSASEIEIQADTLSFQGAQKSVRAAFAAEEVRADYLSSYSVSRQQLLIYADRVPQLLQPLQAHLGVGEHVIPFSDYVDLRAILLSLRRTVHTGICVPRDQLERILRGSSHRPVLLESLLRSEVLELEDDWYRLKPENLATVGFSLQDIKNGEPSRAILDYLGVCRYHPEGT